MFQQQIFAVALRIFFPALVHAEAEVADLEAGLGGLVAFNGQFVQSATQWSAGLDFIAVQFHIDSGSGFELQLTGICAQFDGRALQQGAQAAWFVADAIEDKLSALGYVKAGVFGDEIRQLAVFIQAVKQQHGLSFQRQ